MSRYLTREEIRARKIAQLHRHLATFPEATLTTSNEHLIGPARWPCGHIRHPLNTRHLGDDKECCGLCRRQVDQRYRQKIRAHRERVAAHG